MKPTRRELFRLLGIGAGAAAVGAVAKAPAWNSEAAVGRGTVVAGRGNNPGRHYSFFCSQVFGPMPRVGMTLDGYPITAVRHYASTVGNFIVLDIDDSDDAAGCGCVETHYRSNA
jgi:hypothetical protein